MKALYVRKLYLWPRFQAGVREALERERAGAEVGFTVLLKPKFKPLACQGACDISGLVKSGRMSVGHRAHRASLCSMRGLMNRL